MSWRIYRVVAVTDNRNRDSMNNRLNDDFVLSVSAPSYCTPGITFWLSNNGIEVPKSDCVLLEFLEIKVSPVEFEWDGGRYLGTFEPVDFSYHLEWANNQICHATVYNISSL